MVSLGYRDYFRRQVPHPLVPARVAADNGDLFELAGARATLATLAGKLRHELAPLARPTTGDWVAISEDGERAVIHHVLERETSLVRRAAGTEGRAQLIAANVDVVFLVTSTNEDLSRAGSSATSPSRARAARSRSSS